MNKQNSILNSIKKIFLFIIKILKYIIIAIIKFILSIFNISKKDKNLKNTKSNNIQTKATNIKSSNFASTTLPDDNNILTTDNKVSSNYIEIQKEKINELKQELKNTDYYFSKEYLETIIKEVIEEEKKKEEIEIPKNKNEIKEIKTIIIPKIQKQVQKKEIKNKIKLKKEIKKELITEINKRKISKEIYTIATPIKSELQTNHPTKISKEKSKINSITPVQKEKLTEKINNSPIITVPLIKEQPKINLNQEAINLVTTSTVIATKVATEILSSEKTESKNNNINKEINNSPINESKKISPTESRKEEINNKQNSKIDSVIKEINPETKTNSATKKIPSSEIKINLIKPTNSKPEEKIIPPEPSIPKKDISSPKSLEISIKKDKIEVITDSENLKESIKENSATNNINNEKKPQIITEEPIKPLPQINNVLLTQIDKTIENSKKEIQKEEFEDRNYEEVENKINELLYNLEIYKIQNEKRLTPKQKEILKNEERKLQNAKNNITNQKKLDIEQEQKQLNEIITYEELHNLQLELQKLHIENQLDINETLLNKIEDIEKLNATQIEIIEKKLIKKKLKRASQAMEIPSLLALPFVRNKYFFYFTIGLFVNNHFNFLHHIFRRKTKHYTTIDLSALRNGQDALNNALNLTAENIMYLEYLEQETLQKYPDLALDDEYLKYINKLKNSLNKNYQKLQKKHTVLSKYYKKANKHIKVLKRDEKNNQQKNNN